jgi:DNA-binding GntR family transcriptional regulator
MQSIDVEQMAEPGQVYDRIKSRLLAHMPRPMQLLQISMLAEELGTSTTPVREALTRLAAERVIVYLPKRGFFAKMPSEEELRGLYVVNQTLLHCALRRRSSDDRSTPDADRPSPSPAGSVRPAHTRRVQTPRTIEESAEQQVELIATLFLKMAAQSGNSALIDIVSNINDRLHHTRMVEQEIIPDAREELSQIYDFHNASQYRRTLQAIVCYHEKRLQLLPSIHKELLFRPFSVSGRQ